ncbi:type II restriction endonuclease [Lichenihabitans psoromatis]|uniref:type II restriction endonuclease n=1 Tax=Lichenihabitans psoromatis TaxID=2528642 RepID=UPI001A93E36E
MLADTPVPRTSCRLDDAEIPAAWRAKFPSGADIIRKAVELRSDASLYPDRRLLRRRECEFEIFRSVELAIELPNITAGFTSVDGFIARAQTLLHDARPGPDDRSSCTLAKSSSRSDWCEGTQFAHQPVSEDGKTPAFLFPSIAAYYEA